MASHHLLPLLVFFLLLPSSFSLSSTSSYDSSTTLLRQVGPRKVGGRTEVADVTGDGEVQALGRFAVEERNRRVGGDPPLVFGRVVRAQRQVVSGIKYYLWVEAAPEMERGPAGAVDGERVFQAVVVVKPWIESRELIAFAPTTYP